MDSALHSHCEPPCPASLKPRFRHEADGCCFLSWIRRTVWRNEIPSCKQKECLGARDIFWYAGKQGAHGTLKVFPWESTQWGRKEYFQTYTPPKWELVTSKRSTIFICTNPPSKPGLIANLEDKRTLKRPKKSRRNFFLHFVLVLCHYLNSVLLKVHASSLCSNKTSIRDSKCT